MNRSAHRPRLMFRSALVAGLTLCFAYVPMVASADMQPCDLCDTGPVYAPERVAIGQDRLDEVAQEEAEDQAARSCPGGGEFDVVRVRVEFPARSVRYILTYRCVSPLYDPWP